MAYLQSDYRQDISGGFRIESMRPEHVKALEKLQAIVFPTLSAGELIRAAHYLRHLEIFPEGQFVATREDDVEIARVTEDEAMIAGDGRSVAGDAGQTAMRVGRDAEDEGELAGDEKREVVGMTTTMPTKFDFTKIHHTFSETIGGGWLSHHDPAGDWLYGLDIGVHPAWRGKGLARALYGARQALVEQLGLKGQLTVGMMNGYGEVSASISPEKYYEEFVAGIRRDPTLSAQRAIGFEPMGLIAGYVNDPACGGYGVLMVKKKPG